MAIATTSLNYPANSAAPHPKLVEEITANRIEVPYFLKHINELHEMGVCSAEQFVDKEWLSKFRTAGRDAAPFRVLAILVKFYDNNNYVQAITFDSLVYGTNGSTVRNYFIEISNTQIDLVTLNLPSSTGWQMAPQSYAYYVNSQNGFGSYPRNSQKLVEDLVDQIDPIVDFSPYDNDENGFVDVLLVIHSGPGAEFTGSSNQFWSHKWSILPRYRDGVFISSYTVQPEFWVNPGDMTIGIYAHEMCHGFGLPDLYDTDLSSNGIGKWCIMSNGHWNGPYPGGGSPAHPCAWARVKMGFTSPVNISENYDSLILEDVKIGGQIFRLWTCGQTGPEYFLIENRQKTGFDSYLPESGLLVWHIDDQKSGNTQEWYPGWPPSNHFKVALEQADGWFELEHKIDNGDPADPFPGSGIKTSFDRSSSPNSNAYTKGESYVGIRNITTTDGSILADLTIGLYGCCCGARGDLNGDGENAGINDLIFLVDYIFRNSGNPGTCLKESDVNGDSSGPNIVDLNYLVNRFIRNGPPLPACS